MNASDGAVRPVVAVSAAIIRRDRVLLVRRARPPAAGVFTLPGGKVEPGETLAAAVTREVAEETALSIEVAGPAGFRDVIRRESSGRLLHHYVVIAFAARLVGGAFAPNEEIAEGVWVRPSDIAALPTTEGLADIVAEAFRVVAAGGSAPCTRHESSP